MPFLALITTPSIAPSAAEETLPVRPCANAGAWPKMTASAAAAIRLVSLVFIESFSLGCVRCERCSRSHESALQIVVQQDTPFECRFNGHLGHLPVAGRACEDCSHRPRAIPFLVGCVDRVAKRASSSRAPKSVSRYSHSALLSN